MKVAEIEDIHLLKDKENGSRRKRIFLFICLICIALGLMCTLLYFVVFDKSDNGSESGNRKLDSILQNGVESKVYPGIVAIVGNVDGPTYKQNVGKFTYSSEDTSIELDTMFDIASLTKVVATTSGIAVLYQNGLLSLNTRIASILGSEFSNGGKENITVLQCLLHNAGFAPDPSPRYWETSFGCPNTDDAYPAEDFSCLEPLIYSSFMTETLQYLPGDTYLYSDLSFITLQFVIGQLSLTNGLVSSQDIEKCLARGQPSSLSSNITLSRIVCAFNTFIEKKVFGLTSISSKSGASWMPNTLFVVPEEKWRTVTPTNNDTGEGSYTHKRIQGQVADGNAYAMGGIAGHAGLFATVDDISAFAQYLLQASLDQEGDVEFLNSTTVKLFTTIYNESFSSRALGWTTNAEVFDFGFNHSCSAMSNKTFMHIGYTGTCICIDPVNELYTVILANRVFNCQGQSCPPDISYKMKQVFQQFNKVAVDDYGTLSENK